jgi:hypothetical protein
LPGKNRHRKLGSEFTRESAHNPNSKLWRSACTRSQGADTYNSQGADSCTEDRLYGSTEQRSQSRERRHRENDRDSSRNNAGDKPTGKRRGSFLGDDASDDD